MNRIQRTTKRLENTAERLEALNKRLANHPLGKLSIAISAILLFLVVIDFVMRAGSSAIAGELLTINASEAAVLACLALAALFWALAALLTKGLAFLERKLDQHVTPEEHSS